MPKQNPVSKVVQLRLVPRPSPLDKQAASIQKDIERYRDVVEILQSQLEQYLASKQVAA